MRIVMTRDEMLTRYEDAWRQAALDGVRQWRGGPVPPSERRIDCALTILRALRCGTERVEHLPWTCPQCCATGCTVAGAIIHLNDVHRWDWLDFAKGFREVLAAGQMAK